MDEPGTLLELGDLMSLASRSTCPSCATRRSRRAFRRNWSRRRASSTRFASATSSCIIPFEIFRVRSSTSSNARPLDEHVLAIKLTLYRTSGETAIVRSLTEAAERGKQVVVLIELQARFDEANNIAWARTLENYGVHVVYGVPGLKTHTKTALVVRREPDGIRRYVHIGTGNYHSRTATLYTDLGLFTCSPSIGADVSDLFNALTGFSRAAAVPQAAGGAGEHARALRGDDRSRDGARAAPGAAAASSRR